MFNLVTQKRNDHKLTFEDLVVAKVSPFDYIDFIEWTVDRIVTYVSCCMLQATYEKGTKDEIEEFIYQLLDVNDDGVLGR